MPEAPLLSPETARSDEPSFSAVHQAVEQLLNGTCCGGASASGLHAAPAPFRTLGVARWRETVRPRKPKVPVEGGPFILPDVTVVHHDSAPEPHLDVEVAEGRVTAIRPAGSPVTRLCAVLSKYRGAFVSPALIDLHVHLPADNALRLTELFVLQMLRHGVTVVRDAGDTDGTATPAALAAVLSGALPGPEIHYAYAFVNRPPARWKNCLEYREPSQAGEIVQSLRSWGATWVKSYENLDVPQIAALRRAAPTHGLGVMGHVPYGLGHEQALLPDAQHFLGVPPPRSVQRDHVLNRMIDWDAMDAGRLDTIVRTSVEHGLALTPTLNVTHSLLELERHDAACKGETAKAVPEFFSRIIWHPRHGIAAYRGMTKADFERARRAMDHKHQALRRLHESGVEVRLGTDTQQPFVAPGVGLHREIAEFTNSGIPRRVVLDMATARAARALGLMDVGTVREGARAELLVSRRDPGDAAWSVREELSAVVANGRLVDTGDLDVAIEGELGRFQGLWARHAARLLARFTMHRLARNFVS
jgi:cytosine/adenosine deaminase-related metal-dependent hydrolase